MNEINYERDFPTKSSPILAIILFIAISLSFSSLPLNMVLRDAKPDQRGSVNYLTKLGRVYYLLIIKIRGEQKSLHPGCRVLFL